MNSADNLGFESTEEILESQVDSKTLVPYTRQRSAYFEPFDSISTFTETTVPSEFAEIELDAYELSRKTRQAAVDKESQQKSNNIQYNLRFDKVVISGGNENKAINIERPVSQAVNEITQKVHFDEIPLKFTVVDENKWTKLIHRKAFYIPAICLILVLLGGISYFLSTLFSENHQELPIVSTTTSLPVDTSTPNIDHYKIVKRSDWKLNESIPTAGRHKLMAPVTKIILLSAVTSQCDTEESCMEYINEQQQNAYPDYDDIRENFIIALDGTIFEGRGFENEGETACESDGITCYDGKAITISFAQTADGYEVNSKQQSAFCQFIKDKQETSDIDGVFNAFNHNNLISSTVDLGGYESLGDCCKLYKNVPQIVRRKKTLEAVDDDLRRAFSTKVVLTTTGGETCSTMDECKSAVQNFHDQNIHQSNFMFGGEGFIFEDRNFDLAVNESLYDVLLLSFIGNYSTSSPSQPLIMRLNNVFLEYAIAVGKLPRNHKICVTNEAPTLINAIRNPHPSKYDNFCNEQV